MSQRPYVDARVADVGAAASAAVVAARRWSLVDPVLLRHGMNAIFRCDDVVLRVAAPTAPAHVSIELAEVLRRADVPTPHPARTDVVETGGLSVTAWWHIEEVDDPIDWAAVGRIVRRVHGVRPEDLPDGLPLPSPVDFPWWRFETMLEHSRPLLDGAAFAGLCAAVERHAGWRDLTETVVCHGDVHPGNVMTTAEGPVVIDWDLMCRAPRSWDHGPLMTWTERWGGEPGIYEAFADGYGWSGRGDAQAEAFAELRLVAATLMRVRAGQADPAAKPEADRRLAYWRGELDAPVWHAQ